MADRKLFGLFSGAQVTLMVCAAILAPGAVYATTALSGVVITEPASGRQSFIDTARRLPLTTPSPVMRTILLTSSILSSVLPLPVQYIQFRPARR